MNKNSTLKRAVAGFLAVLMVLGAFVSLRGFNVSAETVNAENDRSAVAGNDGTKGEPTRAEAGNGNPRPNNVTDTGIKVNSHSVSYSEYKQRGYNIRQLELFTTSAADFTTHIATLHGGGYEEQTVWLAQDQLHEPGAMVSVNGGELSYDIPQGKDYWLKDEATDLNPWPGNPMYAYGPNRDWWLRTGTYFPANGDPWELIKKIVYMATPGTTESEHMFEYFRDTVFPHMMAENNDNARYASYFAGNSMLPGCAICINGQYIGADVEVVKEPWGGFYRNVTKWHRNGLEGNDENLVRTYLLPLAFQCAIYDITSGNYKGNDQAVNDTGKVVSHTMEANQEEPGGNRVARRERVRGADSFRLTNPENGAITRGEGSYIRMLVNEILAYARDLTIPASSNFDLCYTTPINKNGGWGNNSKDGNAGENAYNPKGCFMPGNPPPSKTIKVTFHPEWCHGINSNGVLINPSNTPHTEVGVELPEDFTFDVTLMHNGTAVNTANLPLLDDGSVLNDPETGETWDYTWNNQPAGGTYKVIVPNNDKLHPDWVFLPGKCAVETDSDGNVTIIGRFLYNVTEYSIEKLWKNNNTGSTAVPPNASATFQLKQDGKDYEEPVTLSGTKWTHTWDHLPKYIKNGTSNVNGIEWVNTTTAKVYSYSAVEDRDLVSPSDWAAQGDPVPVVKDGKTYYTFTNEKAKEEYDINITKSWNGGTAPEGITIKVNLYQSTDASQLGNKIRYTKELNAAGNWSATWPKLPKYDPQGNLYYYSVREVNTPDGWTSVPPAAHSLGNSALNLVLENNKKQVNVNVVQEWYTGVDAGGNLTGKTNTPANYVNGQYPLRPVGVKIQRLVNGQYVDVTTPILLTKNNDWNRFVYSLEPGEYRAVYADPTGHASTDSLNDGNSYADRHHPEQYGWLELPSYTTIEKDASGNVTITLKALANKTSISVTKVWKDNDGTTVTPGSDYVAKFDLLRDGLIPNEDYKVTLTGSKWTHTWEKLDKYKEGSNGKPTEYVYTLHEIYCNQLAYCSDNNNNHPNATVEKDANGNFQVTNSQTVPTVTSLKVTKKWVSASGEIPGTVVTVTLQRKYDEQVDSNFHPTCVLGRDHANGLSYTFTNLDIYVNGDTAKKWTYFVTEDAVAGYTTTIARDSEYEFTVTNTKNINVTFIQKWYHDIDDNGNLINEETGKPENYNDSTRPYRPVAVELLDSNGNVVTIGGTAQNNVWVNYPNDHYNKVFENLPAGEYTVRYNGAENNTVRPSHYGWLELPEYTTVVKDNDGNVTVTFNALANFVNVTVEKVWSDDNTEGSALTYDIPEISVTLLRDNEPVSEANLTASNLTHTWSKLAKYYVDPDTGLVKKYDYSVVEDELPEGFENFNVKYETSETVAANRETNATTVITNTKPEETLRVVEVNKWLGMDNDTEWANEVDKYIPRSITYQLTMNGEPYGNPVTLENPYGCNKTWDDEAVWENLPKYDPATGEEIVYGITIVDPDDRWMLDKNEINLELSTENEIHIDLTHRWSLVRFKVEKHWYNDGIEVAGDGEITLKLVRKYEDGSTEVMSTLVLPTKNGYSGFFTNERFTNTKEEDEFFPRVYQLDENGKYKRDDKGKFIFVPDAYYIVEEGYNEEIWTPAIPQNICSSDRYVGSMNDYHNNGEAGIFSNGNFVISDIRNDRTGDYSIDKTAKLTEKGTYTATLTAQYNGPAPADENDPDTYIQDTLGLDFHVNSEVGTDTHKDHVKVYIEKLNADGTFTRVPATDAIYNGVTVTTTVSERTGVKLGELLGPNDKNGLTVKVTGFDLEKNGCYIDDEGNAHGYRIVVEIEKLVANGDAVGDRLPIGDPILNDPEENRNSGVCGIYEGSSIAEGDLRESDDTVRKDAKLIFPKPELQIREIVQVYDFGLRQRNDDVLDFFGHGTDYSMGMGDVAHVLAIDYMYEDQVRANGETYYNYTYPYVGARGRNALLKPITYTQESMAHEEFAVGMITVYAGANGQGFGTPTPEQQASGQWRASTIAAGRWVWDDHSSHPSHDEPHRCFGYFEPKEISIREFVVSALIQVHDDADPTKDTYTWCKISFVPATNVYYEAEDFLKPDPAAVGNFVNDKAFTEHTVVDYSVHDRFQNHSTGDLQHIYGYDDAYENGHKGTDDGTHTHATYDAFNVSNGSALKVTLTKDDVDKIKEGKSWPSVEFSFTGEGIEVIASTNSKSGFFAIQVTKEKTSKGKWDFSQSVVTKYVDTRYFGFAPNDPNATTPPDYTSPSNTMHQVPVLRVADLKNATYGVRISAVYLKEFVPLRGTENIITIPGIEGEFEYESAYGYTLAEAARDGETQYPPMTVMLDAIRIFNPFDKDNHVTHHMRSENNGAYETIKNIIRKTEIVDPSNYNINVQGGMYIDYIHVTDENDNPIIPQGGYTLNHYLKFGPNNEMYMKYGDAFAFVLNNVNKRQSLHIGAKVPTGIAEGKRVEMSVKAFGLTNDNKVGSYRESGGIIVNSATPMYYSISDIFVTNNGLTEPTVVNGETQQPVSYTKNLIIVQYKFLSEDDENEYKDGNAILSLTNVKLVNESDHRGYATRPTILADYDAPTNPNPNPNPNPNVGTKDETTAAITMNAAAYEIAMAVTCGIKGDVDGDKTVSMMDALLVIRQAIGAEELNRFAEICADMDDNHSIDMIDAVSIMRKSLGN